MYNANFVIKYLICMLRRFKSLARIYVERVRAEKVLHRGAAQR